MPKIDIELCGSRVAAQDPSPAAHGRHPLSFGEGKLSLQLVASLLPFPVFQKAARRVGVVRIQSLSFAIDVLDYSLFVDDKRGPMRHREFVVQDPVLGRDLARKIAEQGKSHPDLLGEGLIGELTVDADSQYLCSRLLEFGGISLIRL